MTCQRIGGCLHDAGSDTCCCDDNSCDWQVYLEKLFNQVWADAKDQLGMGDHERDYQDFCRFGFDAAWKEADKILATSKDTGLRLVLQEAAEQLRLVMHAFEDNWAINWDDVEDAAAKAEAILEESKT